MNDPNPREEIEETLRKQLQLLYEASQRKENEPVLDKLSSSMVSIASLLLTSCL